MMENIKKRRREIRGTKEYKEYWRQEENNWRESFFYAQKWQKKVIDAYQRRWEIETLFGCLKSKGFCLEETHLVKERRLEKLFFILTLAFIWAYQAGIFRAVDKPIKIKKHGRQSYCLFRYGFEILRKGIINNLKIGFFLLFLIDTKTLKLRSLICS